MGRQRKGRPVNGILVLDKPIGMSSNQALQKVRWLYGAAKAGHTGSLDPLATGVLPLCFGEATKFSRFLLESDKAYVSTFTLGVATTTGDAEGDVLSTHSTAGLTQAQVETALHAFRGDIDQVPSMFSALKHQGQPLYKLARRGEAVEREARSVTVHALELLAFREGEQAEVDVMLQVSKGTYVRSIAEDLGQALGCGGHVSALRRTQAGPFTEAQSVTVAQLETMKEAGDFAAMDALLLPISEAVAHLPEIRLDGHSGYYLLQGQPVQAPNLPGEGMVRVSLDDGEFIGIGEILDDGRLAPRRLVASA
ncbi:MAG TPA: tRNA pseudouridine(55) synthase TruB [Pseudomonadales bacterium]|jgi:tRNA pseudouridine55 synthase